MSGHITPGNLLDNHDRIVAYVHEIHHLKLLCMNARLEAFAAHPNTPLGRRAQFMDPLNDRNDRFYFLADFTAGVDYLNRIFEKLQLEPIRIQDRDVTNSIRTIPAQVFEVNKARVRIGIPVVNLLEDAAQFGNYEIGPDQLTLSELLFELIFRSIYSNSIAELADEDDPTAMISSEDTDVDRILERFSLLGRDAGPTGN